MRSTDFPASFEEVDAWSREQGISTAEGGRKFAQFLVLTAISRSRTLQNDLVFKGGNALEFVYLPNRATTDLDFSFITPQDNPSSLFNVVRRRLEIAVQAVSNPDQTVMRLQSFVQKPPREDAQFPTFAGRVAYAFPDQLNQRKRILEGASAANVVDVEMSVNENVCAWETTIIGESATLNVATPEDIVSEKLRAILQQTVRDRYRSQDVLDIALLHRAGELNPSLVSRFLPVKCTNQGVEARKSAFRNDETRARAHRDYENLRETVRYTFLPFDEAWATVMQLVDSLDIPD